MVPVQYVGLMHEYNMDGSGTCVKVPVYADLYCLYY